MPECGALGTVRWEQTRFDELGVRIRGELTADEEDEFQAIRRARAAWQGLTVEEAERRARASSQAELESLYLWGAIALAVASIFVFAKLLGLQAGAAHAAGRSRP